MTGSLFEHKFTVGGEAVATASRAWISLTATYGVDVAPGQDDALILASVLATPLSNYGVPRAAIGPSAYKLRSSRLMNLPSDSRSATMPPSPVAK